MTTHAQEFSSEVKREGAPPHIKWCQSTHKPPLQNPSELEMPMHRHGSVGQVSRYFQQPRGDRGEEKKTKEGG